MFFFIKVLLLFKQKSLKSIDLLYITNLRYRSFSDTFLLRLFFFLFFSGVEQKTSKKPLLEHSLELIIRVLWHLNAQYNNFLFTRKIYWYTKFKKKIQWRIFNRFSVIITTFKISLLTCLAALFILI